MSSAAGISVLGDDFGEGLVREGLDSGSALQSGRGDDLVVCAMSRSVLSLTLGQGSTRALLLRAIASAIGPRRAGPEKAP